MTKHQALVALLESRRVHFSALAKGATLGDITQRGKWRAIENELARILRPYRCRGGGVAGFLASGDEP